MTLHCSRLFAIFLLVGSPAFGAEPSASRSSEPITAVPLELKEEIARSEAIGAKIFLQDRAAAIATDELVRRDILGKDERLRGWITDEQGKRLTVLFLGETGGDRAALYSVATEEGRIAEDGFAALNPPVPLSEAQVVQFKARYLAHQALSADYLRCSENYNTVVLPAYDKDDGSLHVYLIAASTSPTLFILGGHHRLTISRDGSTIEHHRAFTRGCLNMPRKRGVMIPVVSHILDPYPTEIHVFLSLLYRNPIGVITVANGLSWKVEGIRISVIEPWPQPMR